MRTGLKRLPARFYRLDSGREPVREWLKGLDVADRRAIGEDIKDVEFAWPIGMPLVRSLGRDLWEVRSSLPHGRIARVIFCVEPDCMVLLHGFTDTWRAWTPILPALGAHHEVVAVRGDVEHGSPLVGDVGEAHARRDRVAVRHLVRRAPDVRGLPAQLRRAVARRLAHAGHQRQRAARRRGLDPRR